MKFSVFLYHIVTICIESNNGELIQIISLMMNDDLNSPF